MSIATKCTCGHSLTGVCASSVKECRQLKKETTQLPVEAEHFLNWLSGYRNENGEYIELLKGKYYFVDEYPDDDIYHTEATPDQLIELYKLHHPVEATAYATKIQAAEEQHKLLIKTLLELEEGKRKELQQENAELKAHNDRLKIALENVYRIHGHQWSEYDRNVIKELIS